MTDPSHPYVPPPPGDHGFPAGGPQPPGRWRSNEVLAGVLTALLVLHVVVLLADGAVLLRRAQLAATGASGGPLDFEAAEAVDRWAQTVGTTWLVAWLVTAGVFITWQYRHARNAQVLGQRTGLGPGWAVGGWFIPLAHLVLPAKQLRDSSAWSSAPPERPGRASTLIVPWMATYALGNIIVSAAIRGEPATSEGPQAYLAWLATSDRTEVAGNAVLVVAAVLAVLMVRQLTRSQEAQRPATAAASWPAPATPPQQA